MARKSSKAQSASPDDQFMVTNEAKRASGGIPCRQERQGKGRQGKGRLVRNHSTNLPGLIAILERLCKQPGIDTLTPAVIGRAKSHAPKFRLKVSVPTQGGFKLIARQGKSFQEVFVITHLDRADLEAAIQTSLS